MAPTARPSIDTMLQSSRQSPAVPAGLAAIAGKGGSKANLWDIAAAATVPSVASRRSSSCDSGTTPGSQLRQISQRLSLGATQLSATEKRVRAIIPPALRMITNWDVETYYRSRIADGTLNWRVRMYRYLASPVSSNASAFLTTIILLLSLASVVTAGSKAAAGCKPPVQPQPCATPR